MYNQHPLLRHTDAIDVVGVNGDRCRISGPGMGDWGPELAPHSTGLFDEPFKTNWSKAMLGQRYESWSPQRRDLVWTIHIMNPQTGDSLERDPDLWHSIYSRWMAMWSKEHESTIVYTSVDGERRLGVRLLQDVKSFSAQSFEGGDPHLMPYGSVLMTVAAENPYYIGGTEIFNWETSDNGGASAFFTLPFYNPSTVPIWPKWYLTDRAQWSLPDYSWGWEEFGRGVADTGKTVQLPLLLTGENIHVDSQPDVQTIIAENDNPVMNRMAGRDLEYPILPGAGSSTDGCTVFVQNITNPAGARAELYLPRWYSTPFSTPLVV